MEYLSFAFITDEAYLKYTEACILSLIKHKGHANYRIYLITTLDVKNKLSKTIFSFDGVEITQIVFSDELFLKKQGLGAKHVSSATYIKFMLPNLVPEKTVLYLDGDILINDNVDPIFELLDDECLCAVEDPTYDYENDVIGNDPGIVGFNAGVLLLNLERLRQEDAVTDLIVFYELNKNKIQNADQTVFNAVFRNRYKKISPVWNLQRNYFLLSKTKLNLKKSEYHDLLRHPKVVHFTTNSKPWMKRCANPFKRKYVECLREVYPEFLFDKLSVLKFLQKVNEFRQYHLRRRK